MFRGMDDHSSVRVLPAGWACLSGQALPAGWTGKVWAMHQGIAHVEPSGDQPDYLLFTDADIEYASDALPRLVARAPLAEGA